MPELWNQLLRWAEEEVRLTREALPADLRAHAESVPVSYESVPGESLLEDGWEPDLLGMFVGDPIGVSASEASPIPRRILLFLENLWDFAEEDAEVFRDEVHITYIHEFGHFLGLDESDLEERGLL